MISWRLNAPHKVENETYCVSVTTEYSTKESAFKNSVMFANAVLRERLGVHARWADASMPEKYIKSALGRVFRKVHAAKAPDGQDMVTFKIDQSAPGFVVDTQPFVRNF